MFMIISSSASLLHAFVLLSMCVYIAFTVDKRFTALPAYFIYALNPPHMTE